jgi:hypothetical protein
LDDSTTVISAIDMLLWVNHSLGRQFPGVPVSASHIVVTPVDCTIALAFNGSSYLISGTAWVEGRMANVTYDKDATALLAIDPYDDFISEGAHYEIALQTQAGLGRRPSSRLRFGNRFSSRGVYAPACVR